MYQLIAIINGRTKEQGTYINLQHVSSRIKQLDTQYGTLGIDRPQGYEIVLVPKDVTSNLKGK